MSLKRYATQRDKSEPDIVKALAKAGADVLRLDAIDLLVFYRGGLFLLECKSTRGKKQTMRAKTKRQDDLVERGWPLHFVTSPEQALSVIGAVTYQESQK